MPSLQAQSNRYKKIKLSDYFEINKTHDRVVTVTDNSISLCGVNGFAVYSCSATLTAKQDINQMFYNIIFNDNESSTLIIKKNNEIITTISGTSDFHSHYANTTQYSLLNIKTNDSIIFEYSGKNQTTNIYGFAAITSFIIPINQNELNSFIPTSLYNGDRKINETYINYNNQNTLVFPKKCNTTVKWNENIERIHVIGFDSNGNCILNNTISTNYMANQSTYSLPYNSRLRVSVSEKSENNQYYYRSFEQKNSIIHDTTTIDCTANQSVRLYSYTFTRDSTTINSFDILIKNSDGTTRVNETNRTSYYLSSIPWTCSATITPHPKDGYYSSVKTYTTMPTQTSTITVTGNPYSIFIKPRPLYNSDVNTPYRDIQFIVQQLEGDGTLVKSAVYGTTSLKDWGPGFDITNKLSLKAGQKIKVMTVQYLNSDQQSSTTIHPYFKVEEGDRSLAEVSTTTTEYTFDITEHKSPNYTLSYVPAAAKPGTIKINQSLIPDRGSIQIYDHNNTSLYSITSIVHGSSNYYTFTPNITAGYTPNGQYADYPSITIKTYQSNGKLYKSKSFELKDYDKKNNNITWELI